MRTPDRLIEPSLYIPYINDPKKRFLACIEALPDGVSELVLHPGYPDPDVADSPAFAKIRQIERELASDPEILAAIKVQKIDLISFKSI